jgi:hypothetical protein
MRQSPSATADRLSEIVEEAPRNEPPHQGIPLHIQGERPQARGQSMAALKSANVALSKANDVHLAGSDQTKTLDCAGGWARIAGANNNVTLTGDCAGLTIYGSRNTVQGAFQTEARVRFVGSNNAVTWTTPDGKEPKALHLDASNTMTPGH